MIDNEVELFTAQKAIEEGIFAAIKRGETRIAGSYEILSDGTLKFNQRNFTFVDKHGNFRVGRFKDSTELDEFFSWFHIPPKKGEE